MRNTILTFLGVFGITIAFAQTGNPDSLNVKIEKLKEYYSKSHDRKDSMEFHLRFFEEFPSDFESFNSIYGFDTSEMPLYDKAYDHIQLFNRISCVSETIYYRKVISIAIGGYWDADAINYFQEGLRERVMANPELTFELLKERTEKEIFKFWFFFFGGPVTAKEIPKELERRSSEDQYAIVKRAYYKARERNRN
jgi:hypothetical protein